MYLTLRPSPAILWHSSTRPCLHLASHLRVVLILPPPPQRPRHISGEIDNWIGLMCTWILKFVSLWDARINFPGICLGIALMSTMTTPSHLLYCDTLSFPFECVLQTDSQSKCDTATFCPIPHIVFSWPGILCHKYGGVCWGISGLCLSSSAWVTAPTSSCSSICILVLSFFSTGDQRAIINRQEMSQIPAAVGV